MDSIRLWIASVLPATTENPVGGSGTASVCETVGNQAKEEVPDDPWILENEQRRAAGKYRRVVQMRRRVESAKGGRESIERATPCGCGRAVKSSAFARVITP